jgi:cyclohexadienyl dehydratase
VIGRFARDTGRRIEVVRFRWSEVTRDLAAGRFDVAVGGITMRPERAVEGTFTRPLTTTGAVVLARRGVGRRQEDVDKRTVRLAVNRGGHLEQVARRLFPHASLLPAENFTLPALVVDGLADALVTDDVEADVFAPQLPPAVRLGPFTRDHKAFFAREPGLVATLDDWLRAREADGTLADMRAQWLGPARAQRRSTFDADLAAVIALVDLRLAFMPAIADAKAKARRPIEDAAQEERVLARVQVRASERGLDPAPVRELFRTQLAAAREVQHHHLALPIDRRPPVDALDLEREARPALGKVSDAIVDRLAELAGDPAAVAQLDPRRVAGALDPSLASEAARFDLGRQLRDVRRAPSRTDVCKRTASRLESGPQRGGGADSDQKSRENTITSTLSLR